MKYIALQPMLETRDMESTITFYTSVLGFERQAGFEDEEPIGWCRLQKDDVSIMFCLPNTIMNYPAVMLSGSLYINVEDVDDCWQNLKDKCEVVYAPENFEYGMREFAIKDNNGYIINFGEAISDGETN